MEINKTMGIPVSEGAFKRTFINSPETDALIAALGSRITTMTFRGETVRVTARAATFAEVVPEPMPRFDEPQTAMPFNINGSISFRPGVYGTK